MNTTTGVRTTTNGIYWDNTAPYVWNVPYVWTDQEPSNCIGKAHVFECAHEPKCKCGAVERVMPTPPKGKKR